MSHKLAIATALGCLSGLAIAFALDFYREQRASARELDASLPYLPEDVQ